MAPLPWTESVKIPTGRELLSADLAVPSDPTGLVIFAHGSGSGRHSPRNQFVARQLQSEGLATLLADLLTPPEEVIDRATGQWRFDIALLGGRVVRLIDWALQDGEIGDLPIGLFGASTGAAAALVAAASRPSLVGAVVSRGGRPDLAGAALPQVLAPTLLIVGSRDQEVLALNERARQRMEASVSIEVIAGATHLFEEPGALDEVAALAARWFRIHLPAWHPMESRT